MPDGALTCSSSIQVPRPFEPGLFLLVRPTAHQQSETGSSRACPCSFVQYCVYQRSHPIPSSYMLVVRLPGAEAWTAASSSCSERSANAEDLGQD